MDSAPPSSARAPLIAIGGASLAIVVVFGLWIWQRLKEDERDEPPAKAGMAAPSGSKAERCRACEEQKCAAVLGACSSKECTDVLACVRKSQCGDVKNDTLVPCYCGDVVQDDCFFAKAEPKGACRAVIESGMGTKNALDIGQRYFDTNYESGKALQLVNCDIARCKECL